jgi:hypothetical protein
MREVEEVAGLPLAGTFEQKTKAPGVSDADAYSSLCTGFRFSPVVVQPVVIGEVCGRDKR